VCICTYKRPDYLKKLLAHLAEQESNGLFTYSIVIADNDSAKSAEPIANDFSISSGISVCYCLEPRQNIALTRNKAIEHASGEFIAFIDDDEFPTKTWLLKLFTACMSYGVDGALGPVKPHFDERPPQWVIDGRFYDRPSYPTGTFIDGKKGRTGNVLMKRKIFLTDEVPFREEFLTGEDQDFFRRMIDKGHVFVWCHEALAYETVPPVRWEWKFMLKRALLRGSTSILHPTFGATDVCKSLVAVPLYILFLPVALLMSRAKFVSYTVKLFDHAGRLLALVGINPISKNYVTE
jgi:glycosyltransferase involved in cell wall biosynthesis